MASPFSFGKKEKLKSRKQIDALFARGSSYHAFPVRMAWQMFAASAEAPAGLQVGVSAPKRHFKRAVDRNRIKRLLREAYRLNKAALLNLMAQKGLSGHVFFLFTAKELPTFTEIETSMRKCLHQLARKAHETVA